MAKSDLHAKLQYKGVNYLLNQGYWIRTLEMPSPVGIIDIWGISNCNNYETAAIEVKVSKSDYGSRSQKDKEFSSENLANYCYLLCPKGLIIEPRHPYWGLIWYYELTDRLKVVKKPTRLMMTDLAKIHIMVHLFQNTLNNPEKLLHTGEEKRLNEPPATKDCAIADWQPIETAPRSGIPLLLFQPWRSGYGTRLIGHYANRWVIHHGGKLWDVEPTHWMPLPEPPK